MGVDIKNNTVFLEFYGLPGCGKSTISHMVAEKLRKCNKTVSEPTYDVDHKHNKVVRKMIKTINAIKYGICSPESFIGLIRITKANGYTGVLALNQIVNIAWKLLIYKQSKVDYVVFDEGLIQSAVSLTQTYNCKKNSADNVSTLNKLCGKCRVRLINVCVSVEEAQRRMFSREKHDSRIEKIKNIKQQEEALREFNRQLGYIKNKKNSIIIDSEKLLVEDIVSRIMEVI